MQNNWELSLDLKLEADEESDIAMLLEVIAERIRAGEPQGNGDHCAGIYEFTVNEFDPAEVDDIERTGPVWVP